MVWTEFQNTKYKEIVIGKYNIYINIIFTKYKFLKMLHFGTMITIKTLITFVFNCFIKGNYLRCLSWYIFNKQGQFEDLIQVKIIHEVCTHD